MFMARRDLFIVVGGCILAIVLYITPISVHALQSTNYRFSEEAIGTGNLLQSSSANFKAVDGINDLAVGHASSSNFQVEAGSKTDPEPWLSFSVNSSNADFGVFSPVSTATATATFSVLNHTSYGYIVQIIGTPPTNDGHVISAMSTTGTSNIGTEQFGINLVANTVPTSFGANPDNGQFGQGIVNNNYSTANNYRYVSGETIASASKSSGITNYTLSLIVNVAPLTPGGKYVSPQTLVVTGTY